MDPRPKKCTNIFEGSLEMFSTDRWKLQTQEFLEAWRNRPNQFRCQCYSHQHLMHVDFVVQLISSRQRPSHQSMSLISFGFFSLVIRLLSFDASALCFWKQIEAVLTSEHTHQTPLNYTTYAKNLKMYPEIDSLGRFWLQEPQALNSRRRYAKFYNLWGNKGSASWFQQKKCLNMMTDA